MKRAFVGYIGVPVDSINWGGKNLAPDELNVPYVWKERTEAFERRVRITYEEISKRPSRQKER